MVYKVGIMFFVFVVLVGTSVAIADRGGWADPEGGWEFIEEWDEIPPYEYDPWESRWNHNNGSDQYSGNANTEIFQENGWEGGEVVRIDQVDGENVLTLIDLGDPRDWTGGDPSDRKLMFAAMANREEGVETPISNGGITLLVRYRMMPLDLETPFQDDNDWADPPFNFKERPWIPEQYDRVQVGIGYYDSLFPDHEISIGVGYYEPNSVLIQSNTLNEDGTAKDPDDGSGNILIKDGIDTTEFHSIWITAIAPPDNWDTPEFEAGEITVKAWIDGSAEPVAEGIVLRGPDVADRPDPHDLSDFSGLPQAIVECGMCATNNYGAMQIDYICARFDEAIEPTGGTPIVDWSLY